MAVEEEAVGGVASVDGVAEVLAAVFNCCDTAEGEGADFLEEAAACVEEAEEMAADEDCDAAFGTSAGDVLITSSAGVSLPIIAFLVCYSLFVFCVMLPRIR